MRSKKMNVEEEASSNQFHVSFVPSGTGVYTIYLYGEIESAEQFIPAIEVLENASEGDVVVIHLSTNGGCLGATDTFLSAMDACQAKIIVKASGGVHSAGTLILLNADEFSLSDNFSSLLHNGSLVSSGKYSDWRGEVRHTEKYMERVIRSAYGGFLLDSEIDDLLDGKDIWLDRDGWIERWERMQDNIAALFEEEEGAED